MNVQITYPGVVLGISGVSGVISSKIPATYLSIRKEEMVPAFPTINNNYIINATVINNGINDELDVDLFLYLDNVLVVSIPISYLPIGTSETINYLWTPTEYGTYNFTAYAPPIPGESLIQDNIVTELILISEMIFFDDFESGLSKWDAITGLWHLTDTTSSWPNPCHSPTHSMWFGQESTGNYETGDRVMGDLISIPFSLVGVDIATLEFYHWKATEQFSPYDASKVYISTDNVNWDLIYEHYNNIAPWEKLTFDISKYRGNNSVHIKFSFDTVDPVANNYRGWLVDDIKITIVGFNTAPNAPTNPIPADESSGVSVNPSLSVDVFDPDGDTMDVSFYDASDDSLIGTDTGVLSGGTASVSWLGLSEDITYQWYAIANDGQDTTQSATWSFTVGEGKNFTIIWENDANDGMKNHYFIDLNDDGKLELIRNMPNYITSIYTLIENGYEFYTNLSIAVYEFGDYDGDGINELVGRPATDYDYYFYNFSWDSKTLNLENIWETGYDDRGQITFGDVDNDGKEELIYSDNGIAYGGHEGRYRLISFDGSTFKELQSFDEPNARGWDGYAQSTLIDIDGDGFDEIVCAWGYGSLYDGVIRIFDDSSNSYALLKQYSFERDPTFLNPFDEHEDLNGDGSEDLVVGMALTFVDNYRYIIWYNSSTSSYSYQKITKQVQNGYLHYGVGRIYPNDSFPRYVSFFCPGTGSNEYWSDRIRLYHWNEGSLTDPIDIMLDKTYSNPRLQLRLNVRDINGDGFDEIIWDGSNSQGKQVTFFLFMQDTSSPTWDPIPIDQVVEYGEDLSYDLNASDPSGIDDWWLNDTTYFTIDSNGVITNIGQVPVGVYWLEVRAYDPYGYYCTADIKITVEDTTNPTWDLTPTDQIIEFLEALSYDIDASDLSGITLYWINDTSNFNIDSNGVLTNTTLLIPGTYWLELRAYDPYNNYCSVIIKIIVKVPEELPKTIPPGIPGYNIIFLISTISLISLLVIRKQIRKKP